MNYATAMHSRRNCDAFVNNLEDRIAHEHVLVADPGGTRQLESTAVESFVSHDCPRAVPSQALHAVAALSDKDKQRTRARLHPHPLAHERAQALAAKPHVDRLKRHVDRQTVRDHRGVSLKVATTARSNSPSNPRRT
jgi:hypothetical protein